MTLIILFELQLFLNICFCAALKGRSHIHLCTIFDSSPILDTVIIPDKFCPSWNTNFSKNMPDFFSITKYLAQCQTQKSC